MTPESSEKAYCPCHLHAMVPHEAVEDVFGLLKDADEILSRVSSFREYGMETRVQSAARDADEWGKAFERLDIDGQRGWRGRKGNA